MNDLGPGYADYGHNIYFFHFLCLPNKSTREGLEEGAYAIWWAHGDEWVYGNDNSQLDPNLLAAIREAAMGYKAHRAAVSVNRTKIYYSEGYTHGRPHSYFTTWVEINFQISGVQNPEKLSHGVLRRLAKAMDSAHSPELESNEVIKVPEENMTK